MNSEQVAKCGHRIIRFNLPNYRELFRESDIKSEAGFFYFYVDVSMHCNFLLTCVLQFFECDRRGSECFSCSSSRNGFTHHFIVERAAFIALVVPALFSFGSEPVERISI
jgi:intracellular multiplication protein IcmO